MQKNDYYAPTRQEMYYAYLSVEGLLSDNMERLPLPRKADDFFCVFCFQFYENVRHRCPGVNEAERRVNRELNSFFEGVLEFNHDLCERLIAFAKKREDRWAKKKVIKPPTTVNPAPASMSMARGNLHGTLYKKKKLEQQEGIKKKESSPEDSADEYDSSQSGQSSSQTDKEREPYRTQYGRSIKRVLVGNPLATEPAPKRKQTKKENNLEFEFEQPAKPISETSEKRRKKLIKYALDAGFRIPAENVPCNLPADKSQWTREDYKKDIYGPVYVALQNFVPDYLKEENKELLDDGYQSPVDEEESEDDESDNSSVAEKMSVDESATSEDTVPTQKSNNDFESTSHGNYRQDSSIRAIRRNEETSVQNSSVPKVVRQQENLEFNNSSNHVPMDDEKLSNADPKEQEHITVNDVDDDDEVQIVEVVYNVEPTEKQKEIAEINKREEKRAKEREIMLASHPDDQHEDGRKNCTTQ